MPTILPRRVRFRIVVAVSLRPLVGDAERLAARHDRHAVHGISARHDEPENRVAAFVIRDAFAIFLAQQQRSFGAEHDLLERIQKILVVHFVLFAPRGKQCCFVDEVVEIRAG